MKATTNMLKALLIGFISLILISATCSAQKTDKVAHFGVGYATGALSSSLVLSHSNGKNEWFKTLAVGFGSSALIGCGKEVYDYMDYGVFDFKDLGATVLGGVLGSVTIKITIKGYEKKHLL